MVRVYILPLHEDFYDFYDDDDYDLAVMDEFRGHKTIQWMNLWCQGGTNNLRKKGSQILKKKQIPTIIISNFSLEECYSKVEDSRLETLRRRLEIVHVTELIKLPF